MILNHASYTPSLISRWSLQQVPAEINIRQTPADIEIDYTATRASIGYEKCLDLQFSFSYEALDVLQQGIDRRVSEGKLLEQQVGKHGTFRELVKQEEQIAMKSPELVAVQPLQIKVTTSHPQISVSLGGVKVNYAFSESQTLGTKFDRES